MPRRMKRSDRTSITSIALSLRATRIAKHSWVNSSKHVEHPILASVMGAVLDEVIGPDMIALLRAQPHARSVGQPEPAALGLLRWDLQPLARQIRSTRLSLIIQPACRSSPATLR